MKKYIPLALLSLLCSVTLTNSSQATVGAGNSRVYLELCKSVDDSDCIESVSFKTPTIDYPKPEVAGTGGGAENIMYFYDLAGTNLGDGGSRVRVEARIENSRVLTIIVAGTNTKPMNPLPAKCNASPEIMKNCVLVGDLGSELIATISLRIKSLIPGIVFGSLDGGEFKTSTETYGTKLTVSGRAMRMMGYLNEPGFDEISQIAQPSGDYITDTWMLNIIDKSQSPFGKCSQAGLAFVSSNAEKSQLPIFNSSLKTMDMQTASSHFEPDGKTVFKGLYSTRISESLVKCIWGISGSEATTQAQVQILSNSGDSTVATFASGYKDGWLSLDARNYEYSNPTIRVSMRNTTANSTQMKDTNSATSKITITCVKGKTTKKVSALKPTCPSGFKRK